MRRDSRRQESTPQRKTRRNDRRENSSLTVQLFHAVATKVGCVEEMACLR